MEQVEEILKEEMERAAGHKVPLLVDMHTGNNNGKTKIRRNIP